MNEGLLKLWCLCMTRANWEANIIKMDGVTQPVKLRAGQFITGRYELHGKYHGHRKGYKKRFPSADTLWRWLKVLEKMQFLHIKSTNKFSIITMANWPTEQTEKQKVHTNLHNSCTTAAHRETLTNHYKEGVKKETPIIAFKEKDRGKTQNCNSCGKEFRPTKPWHDVCDDCYQPEKQRGYNFKVCSRCGAENSTVGGALGLCSHCSWKTEKDAVR